MADEKLVKAIRVRLSEEELQKAKALALSRGMTVSQLFRLAFKKELLGNGHSRRAKNKRKK